MTMGGKPWLCKVGPRDNIRQYTKLMKRELR